MEHGFERIIPASQAKNLPCLTWECRGTATTTHLCQCYQRSSTGVRRPTKFDAGGTAGSGFQDLGGVSIRIVGFGSALTAGVLSKVMIEELQGYFGGCKVLCTMRRRVAVRRGGDGGGGNGGCHGVPASPPHHFSPALATPHNMNCPSEIPNAFSARKVATVSFEIVFV